jgi:hypothetical protein
MPELLTDIVRWALILAAPGLVLFIGLNRPARGRPPEARIDFAIRRDA